MDGFAMFIQCDEMENEDISNSVWSEFFEDISSADEDNYEIQNMLLFREDYKRPFHRSISELMEY